MASSAPITLAPEGALELAPKVILGTVDVAAVGARVLLSLEPAAAGWSVRETVLHVRGLQPPGCSSASDGGGGGGGGGDSLRPVLAAPGAEAAQGSDAAAAASASTAGSACGSAPAVLLRNFYAPAAAGGAEAGSTCPQVSLLILNALIPEDAQAEVAAALLELVEGAAPGAASEPAEGGEAAAGAGAAAAEAAAAAVGVYGSAAPSLTVVAAMLMQQLSNPAALSQHLLNGASALDPALPPLQPPSTHSTPIRVRDGQLAALLHVLEVSGTAAVCLLAPGHKPPSSTTLDLPASVPACDTLGAALAGAFGLRYDAERCRTIRALYKWFVPEKAAGSDVMYL